MYLIHREKVAMFGPHQEYCFYNHISVEFDNIVLWLLIRTLGIRELPEDLVVKIHIK